LQKKQSKHILKPPAVRFTYINKTLTKEEQLELRTQTISNGEKNVYFNTRLEISVIFLRRPPVNFSSYPWISPFQNSK